MYIFKSNTLVTDMLLRRRIGRVKQVVEITSPTGPMPAQRQKCIRKRQKLYPLCTCLTLNLYQPNVKHVRDQSQHIPDQRRVNKFSVAPSDAGPLSYTIWEFTEYLYYMKRISITKENTRVIIRYDITTKKTITEPGKRYMRNCENTKILQLFVAY